MEEKQVLFSVTAEGEGTEVMAHVDGAEQEFQVALAIYQLVRQRPTIMAMIALIAKMQAEDPEFKKIMNENTVELPDFDNILKNIK